MGPEEGHFICRTARYRMVEADLGVCQPECARTQLHTLQVLTTLLSIQILLSLHFLLFPRAVPPTLSRRCRRRGARLVLGRSMASSSGTAGGTLRGRLPQRLARALPRPGPHAPNLRRATERCEWVGKQAADGDQR